MIESSWNGAEHAGGESQCAGTMLEMAYREAVVRDIPFLAETALISVASESGGGVWKDCRGTVEVMSGTGWDDWLTPIYPTNHIAGSYTGDAGGYKREAHKRHRCRCAEIARNEVKNEDCTLI